MKILITGGPTNEAIDEVMKITNMSTGRSAINLAHMFAKDGHEVTLIGNTALERDALFVQCDLAKKTSFSAVESTADMQAALDKERNTEYDLVIHNSAVGDYKAQYVSRAEDLAFEIAQDRRLSGTVEERAAGILEHLINPQSLVFAKTKISSNEPNLMVKLALTEKLISHLREWFPKAKLVGFKLLENVSKEELTSVAKELCVKNDLDYVLANDLALINKGQRLWHAVNKKGFAGKDFEDISEVYEFLKSL